jgi:hypothetical protein
MKYSRICVNTLAISLLVMAERPLSAETIEQFLQSNYPKVLAKYNKLNPSATASTAGAVGAGPHGDCSQATGRSQIYISLKDPERSKPVRRRLIPLTQVALHIVF